MNRAKLLGASSAFVLALGMGAAAYASEAENSISGATTGGTYAQGAGNRCRR
jgi:hypothetical protein